MTQRSVGADWSQVKALVYGLDAGGFAAADALLFLTAQVWILVEAETDDQPKSDQLVLLEMLGAKLLTSAELATNQVEFELIIVTESSQLAGEQWERLQASGAQIWSEAELAWQLRPVGVPWLVVTGPQSSVQIVSYLNQMLQNAGLISDALGPKLRPIAEVVMDTEIKYDFFPVFLTPRQLNYSESIQAEVGVLVDLTGLTAAELSAVAGIYQQNKICCVYQPESQQTEEMVIDADVQEGCRAIGVTLGIPSPSMLGIVEEVLCDRAFIAERRTSATEICTITELVNPTPENLLKVLAAAAAARAVGVSHAVIAKTIKSQI